jgi:hypothetical protein
MLQDFLFEKGLGIKSDDDSKFFGVTQSGERIKIFRIYYILTIFILDRVSLML